MLFMTRFAAALASASALLLLAGVPLAHAQSPARISGQVLDPERHSVSAAVVRLVSDAAAMPGVHPLRYTLIGDSLGKFSQEGVAPGAYLVMVFTGGKGTSVLRRVLLKPGEAVELTLSTSAVESQLAITESRTSISSKVSTQTR